MINQLNYVDYLSNSMDRTENYGSGSFHYKVKPYFLTQLPLHPNHKLVVVFDFKMILTTQGSVFWQNRCGPGYWGYALYFLLVVAPSLAPYPDWAVGFQGWTRRIGCPEWHIDQCGAPVKQVPSPCLVYLHFSRAEKTRLGGICESGLGNQVVTKLSN